MSRRQLTLTWLALIGLAILVFFPREYSSEPQPVELKGSTMGTTYSVKLYPSQEQLQQNNLFELVDNELERINQLMSTYQPDSELSLLNQLEANTPLTFSSDSIAVLHESKRLYEASGGAFDVTVGPLVNLWGFGPDGKVESKPSDDALSHAKEFVGMDLIDIRGNSVMKLDERVYLDFSSIAKGYGVDRVANLLEGLGIHNYLVEVGGELRFSGNKPNGSPWTVAIEKPVTDRREVQVIIKPKNLAMATSGDYRNYFEEDGVRYSHTIDPRTGYPINHKLASVTVLHQSAMSADGLATMLTVLGPVAAMEYAEANQLAVYLIVKTDSGFQGLMSSQFEALFPAIQ